MIFRLISAMHNVMYPNLYCLGDLLFFSPRDYENKPFYPFSKFLRMILHITVTLLYQEAIFKNFLANEWSPNSAHDLNYSSTAEVCTRDFSRGLHSRSNKRSDGFSLTFVFSLTAIMCTIRRNGICLSQSL